MPAAAGRLDLGEAGPAAQQPLRQARPQGRQGPGLAPVHPSEVHCKSGPRSLTSLFSLFHLYLLLVLGSPLASIKHIYERISFVYFSDFCCTLFICSCIRICLLMEDKTDV